MSSIPTVATADKGIVRRRLSWWPCIASTTSTDQRLGIEVDRWRVPAAYVIATVGSLVAAGILLPFRADVAHTLEAFFFLVPVVLASWLGGVGPGVAAAIVSSALFNVGFLPPYGTFDLERPEYLGAFLAFLAMSLVISWLVGVARERAAAAEDREAEVRLLFDLSHVLVSERAEGLLPALARAAERLGFVWPSSGTRTPARGMAWVPPACGRGPVGWLVFVGDRPSLTQAETRVVRTFADEVALVVPVSASRRTFERPSCIGAPRTCVARSWRRRRTS